MDLRCHFLPTSLKLKPRVAAAPILKARPRHGIKTVQRIVCRKAAGSGKNDAATPNNALGELVKNGAAAALLGVATTALVGTPSCLASDTQLITTAGRSRSQHQDLERIIQERNGGKSLSDLLSVSQTATRVIPRSNTTPSISPSISTPSTTTSPLLQSRLPYVPAPSLRTDPPPPSLASLASPPSPLTISTTTSPLDISQNDTPQNSMTSIPPAHRTLLTSPAVGQLPLQLAAIGTSLTLDSGALAHELQDWMQPGLASLSASVNALQTDTGAFTNAMLHSAADSGADLQLSVASLGDSISPAMAHMAHSVGDQMTVVLEKGAAVPATMAVHMDYMAGSLSTMKTGAVLAAEGVLLGMQSEASHLGSMFGEGVNSLATGVSLGAAQMASLSVEGLERLLGGQVASEQMGMLASVFASSTALGTVGLASKRKLEAQNQELINHLEKMTADHEASLAALKSRIMELQDSLAAVESQMAYADHTFTTKLADAGLELNKVADLLQAEKQSNTLMGLERDQLVRDLEIGRLERQQLTAEADTIRQQLEEAHLQWSEKEGQCKQFEEELTTTMAERLALRRVLEQLQNSSMEQLTAAAAMEETYSSRLGNLEQQVTDLSNTLSSTEYQLGSTEQELQEVLEVNVELHENLEQQTMGHAQQLAMLEQDWTLRITLMENKYIERLSDIEQDYEGRLVESETDRKSTKAELDKVSVTAASAAEQLKLVEDQLAEVSAMKFELEDHQQQMECKYLEFEAETLATIKALKQDLQEERSQHAVLLTNTGEMQELVAGLQSQKELLAEELEALRVSTAEQIHTAFADSAHLQQLNLKLESQLAALRQDCDERIAAMRAEMAAVVSSAENDKQEAEKREKMAVSKLEITQEQLREAVTESTKASMQLSHMEQEFQELAQQALQDSITGENKLVEFSERYQAAIAQLQGQLQENEQAVTARVEAEFSAELLATKEAAQSAEESLVATQAERLQLKQQTEELRDSLTKQQAEATKLAAIAEEEQKRRMELEEKANEATELAAGLEQTYSIQLHFAERENTRLAGLLDQEQAVAVELREQVERMEAENGPLAEMMAEMMAQVEAERDALREEQEELRLAMEEQSDMNASLKQRIAELEASKAENLATTTQQLQEAKQQLENTVEQLHQVTSQSQDQADLNASLKQRIAELETSKQESLATSGQELLEANEKLAAASQKLNEVAKQQELAAEAAKMDKICNHELQLQVQELKQQLHDAVVKRDGDNGVLVKELEMVKQEKDVLAVTMEQFKGEKDTLMVNVEHERQAKKALAEQIALLQVSQAATMKALEDERRRSHKAVEEESGRSRSLQSQVSELQRRLERHSKMAVTTPKGADSRSLHLKLSAMEQERAKADAALWEERQRVEALRHQLEETNSSLDQVTKENHELQSEKALNARLKRRLSELQRGWGTDSDQERMLTLLKVEQSKAEDLERAALRAQREKREVEARLERQMAMSKERTEELTAQVQELEHRLRQADEDEDEDEDDNGSGPGLGRAQLVEHIAQWKKDHQVMLDLAERNCSSRIESIKMEYEQKIEQLEQQTTAEAEKIHALKVELQEKSKVGDMQAAKALVSSPSGEPSNTDVNRLRRELQHHARAAASAQEAAYIARCKLDEECHARMAVEELLQDLRQELEDAKVWETQMMADVEKQNRVFFGSSFRNHRQDRGDEGNGPRWVFGMA